MRSSTLYIFCKKSLWIKVLLIYLAWHLLITGIGLYAQHEFGPGSPAPSGLQSEIPSSLRPTVQFDSYHYLLIIDNGYGQQKSAEQVFFPLFPVTVKALTVLNVPTVWAGFLVNLIAGYFACLFLALVARQFFEDKPEYVLNALLIFLVFPTAYFLTAFYTEAMFCALGFGAFYFARRQNWALACLLLVGITATRLPGLVFVVAVFVEYLSSKKFKLKRIDKQILWFLLAPLGLVAYMVYLNKHFQDPLMFIHAYSYSNWTYQKLNLNIFATVFGQFQWLVQRVLFHSHTPNVGNSGLVHTTMFLGSWLVLVGSATWAYTKKYPPSFVVLLALSAILFALNSNFISVNRYILPMFPMYLLLADFFTKRKRIFSIYIAGSAVIMSMLAILFAVGHWTG